MNDAEFDAIVDRIQDEVFAEAKDALGEKGFERWRNPRFCGKIADADGFARVRAAVVIQWKCISESMAGESARSAI